MISPRHIERRVCCSSLFLYSLRATWNTNTFCSPDKNPNVKGVHERFARLGVISTILRNKEGRERYVIGPSQLCCSQMLAFLKDMISSTKMASQNGEVLGTIIHDSDLVSAWVCSILLVSPYASEGRFFLKVCFRVFDYLNIWSTIFGSKYQFQTWS